MSAMCLETRIIPRAERRHFSREMLSLSMNGKCSRIIAACVRLWIIMSLYLSSGSAAPSWCSGSSVDAKREMVCSSARKLSMNVVEVGTADGNHVSEGRTHEGRRHVRGLQLDERRLAASKSADALARRAAVENPLTMFGICPWCMKKLRTVGLALPKSISPYN